MRERVEAVIEAARRTVDAREMAAIPRCELDPVNVDLGDVHYAEAKSVRLLLRNVGQVSPTSASSIMCVPAACCVSPSLLLHNTVTCGHLIGIYLTVTSSMLPAASCYVFL